MRIRTLLAEKIADFKVAARRVRRGLRLRQYFNFQNGIMAVAAMLCGSWLIGSVSAMTRNWELVRQVETKKRALELLRLETQALEIENQYYASKEYQELAARRQHNKMFEGETLVILPENTPAAKAKFQDRKIEGTKEISNFEQWAWFLLGRKK